MFTTGEMFLTEQKLERRVELLSGFRFVGMQSIAPMTAMPGTLGVDDVYRGMPDKIEGGSIAIGDEFVGRDRYLWAQKTVTLPAHRDGFEVYGLFNFGETGGGHNSGFESLLYVDGRPFQGVDTNHNDVNFESLQGRAVTLTFMLWTGLEGGGPKREWRHRIQQADLGYLHTATDQFYYLAKAISQTLPLLEETDAAKYALMRALDNAFNLIDWDADHFYDTVDAALAALKGALAEMHDDSPITVNVVGHTHIDVAWLWRLKHTREKAMRSFSTVLKLMNEFDEYTFIQSQPQLYAYIQNDCPEIYEGIKKRVADGHWEADGGMWLEADCNISSGEALTRQFLYGMRLFGREFNHKCEYLWLPDVFGYSWALPQILKGVGIDTFMTTKISWNQFNTMPHDLFKWRGIDGSEVMTYFITTPDSWGPIDGRFSTYNGMMTPRAVIGSWIKFHDKNLSNETLLSYGYGDGGGGVNREMLKMRRAMAQIPGLPHVETALPSDFFRRLHEKLDATDQYIPTWDGELYLEYHRGTYTSQGYNKKMNRRMEFGLAACEWLSALSMLSGGRYDSEAFVENWRTVLRNQFHDIIPGSSIGEVYQDCHREYGQVEESLARIQSDAFAHLAKPSENAFTLWHFGSFPRNDTVFIQEKANGVFKDSNGNMLASQKVEDGYYVNVNLPALSVSTVTFEECACEAAETPFNYGDTLFPALVTPHYRVQWNEKGQIARLYDRDNERDVLASGACGNVLEFYEDRPLGNDNWDIDIFYLFKHEQAALVGAPEVVENGALRFVLRFRYAYRHSEFTQDVIFYANSRRIDFKTEAEWHEDHRVMKAAFPVNVRSTRATYDIQYGHVERPTHYNTSWDYARFEVVAHKWADLSEEGYGVSILNDCKYGHNVYGNAMHITLLKSSKHPDTEADMGHHAFTYALLPHAGNAVQGDTIEESVCLNLPVHVLPGRAANAAHAETGSRSIYVDALKKAEDGDDLILRVHECRGGRVECDFDPGFDIRGYIPCNLLEEPTGEIIESEKIHISLSPFKLATYRLVLE